MSMAEGTFYKKTRYGLSRYTLGDCQGMVSGIPEDFTEMVEYDRYTARKLLPAACV